MGEVQGFLDFVPLPSVMSPQPQHGRLQQRHLPPLPALPVITPPEVVKRTELIRLLSPLVELNRYAVRTAFDLIINAYWID